MKRIFGTSKSFRLSVVLFACSPALGFECPNPILLLNSVGQDFTAQRNIKAEDLEVTVDGKPVAIVSLSLTSGPHRVVLIVDASSSMHPSDERPGWRRTSLFTATFAADSAPEGAPLAMLTIRDEPRRESDAFETRERVERRILDLAKTEPHGKTALFDSIDQALALLGTPKLGDAIYVVSDGGDNHSHVSFSRLKEKLVSHGVRVFVFPLPGEQFRTTSEEQYGADRMEGLAEFSGGYVIRVPWTEITGKEQAWLERSATQIRNQAQAMYELKLDIPGASGRIRKVKVVVNKGARNGGALAYPRELAACPSQP
jgi:hypothetical protein